MSLLTSPPNLRAVAFVDGQNLFNDAKREFGYEYLNIDVKKLVTAICQEKCWQLAEIRFYTGVPTAKQNSTLKKFWDNKLFQMRLDGVVARAFDLRDREAKITLYRRILVSVPSSRTQLLEEIEIAPCWVTDRGRSLDHDTVVSQAALSEKGVDVSIAVDAIRYALEAKYDVCLILSRDADLTPAIAEIKNIGLRSGVKFLVATVFPSNRTDAYGIPQADITIRITKAMYDNNLDPKDYFPKKRP